MLSKKNRISDRHTIQGLWKNGKIYKTRHLVFRFLEKPPIFSEFAVAVSKKIFKNAVQRNHLRRQIMEGIRPHLDALEKQFWVVVIPRSDVKNAKPEELKLQINQFFNYLHNDAK
ncbi:ribonuclease P protein component [Candidatus Peregrinibacteria bacterium CG_4_10_14_0_2_um_filter_43_11]|nr:MAG: ribonuclease P protein component [Candidatus Peregrinibacteria bacterium CG_4_10_14_0_2_um_filter_43_11]